MKCMLLWDLGLKISANMFLTCVRHTTLSPYSRDGITLSLFGTRNLTIDLYTLCH